MGILKGIAIATGVGIAIGLRTSVNNRRDLPRSAQRDDGIFHREFLFDRIDCLEQRLDALENQQSAPMVDFDRRLTEQESTLRELRTSVDETERRLAAQTEIAGKRTSDLESSLRTELDLRFRQNLESLEKSIDGKISDRISALERTLAEQSASIAALRMAAETGEANLQRLIGAVDRLCESAQIARADRLPAPPAGSGSDPESFQEQLDQAMRFR
jgi:uncharacterized coiled-coil protein SlyX